MTSKPRPRPGLGDDWMDDVLGTDDPQRPPPASGGTSSSPARPRPAKGRVTAGVDADVLERARNAVWQLAGPPAHLTMAELVEQAIRREVERLEAEHNDGAPFPARSAQLRPGRPLGR